MQKQRFLKLFLLTIVLIVSKSATSQNAFNGIFFQAIARDNFSNPAKDRIIHIQSTIIQTSISGTKVLVEEHKSQTDGTGVFSISIGQGARIGGTASNLSAIEWAKGPYFLNLQIAIEPIVPSLSWDYKKELVDLGTTPFGTVPYALYSGSSGALDDKLSIADTAKMLAIYAKAQVVNNLSTQVNSKLSAADTTTMLAPYAKMVNALVASNITSLTASTVNAALDSKVNVADSGKIYVTPLAIKKGDSITLVSLGEKLNIADSGSKYVTPLQLRGVSFDTASLITKINKKVNLSDSTTVFVTPLQLAAKTFDSTAIYTQLALKLNKTDTSALLRKSDTTTLSNRINLKVNNSDVIDVAHGGTGLTTIGTNGQLLTSNGSILSWTNPSAMGLTAINGLTAGTQTLTVGNLGTAPNFVSTGSTHTLNIPMASSTGVTKGLISNIDYTNFSNKIDASQKGVANGIATLDNTSKIPASQIPVVSFQSANVVPSQSAMLALSTAVVGSIAIRTDINRNFVLSATDPSILTNWVELAIPTSVTSVNGYAGPTVSLTTADIAPSANRNYVTTTQLGVLSNTSGTNTGDQTIILTGDVTGTGTGSFATIVNSVGGVSSSTIASLPTSVASNTSSITSNTNSIATLNTNVNANTSSITAETTRATNAENALDTRVASNTSSITSNTNSITTLNTNVSTNTASITAETTRATNAENALDTRVASNTSSITSNTNSIATLNTNVSANTASITAETTRATNAESALDTRVASNTASITSNTNSIATLNTNVNANTSSITAEVTRATNAENTLDTKVVSNTSSITSNTNSIATLNTNVATNTASITAETTRAINAESALDTRVTSNTSSITAETTRATNAENALDTRVASNTASITSNTNSINTLTINVNTNTSSITTNISDITSLTTRVNTATSSITSNTSDIATINTSLSNKANLNSPSFTGTPSLPSGTTGITQSPGDNSIKLATTAFVAASISASSAGLSSVGPISGTSNANGAIISGTTQLILTPADANFGGIVTTSTQTFAGAKTFSNTATFNTDISVNGLTVGGSSTYGNTALGYLALKQVQAGSYNAGSWNTAIGHESMYGNTTGNFNTAIGRGALVNNTTGSYNTTVGYYSGKSLKTISSAYATENTFIGNSSGAGITTGSYNTILGSQTYLIVSGAQVGIGITTGSYNTIIGGQIFGLAPTLSNNIILADGAGNIRAQHNGTTGWTLGTIVSGTWSGTTIGSNVGGAGTVNGLMKANGNGVVSAALAGTDFQVPLTTTQLGVLSNTSGTNTGDQTITLTGDVLGIGTGTFTTSLTNSGVIAGSYGSNTSIPTFTVDEKGRLTSAGTITSTAVPYTGATQAVNLGAYDLTVNGLTVGTGINGGAVSNTNTALGSSALAGNNSGSGANTAIGTYALRANTTGSNNTGVGYYALQALTIATDNTALGAYALRAGSSGYFNTSIGSKSMFSATSGANNTAVGVNALYGITTAGNNTAMGFLSLNNLTTGDKNIALGYKSGSGVTSGTSNIMIGANTGSFSMTTGSYNTIIGTDITGLPSTLSNNIILADGAGNIRAQHNGTTGWALGTIASGTWSGTSIAVANGGTGATTASGARMNLGLGTIATKTTIADADIDASAAIAFSKLNISKADITGLGVQENLTAGSGISINAGTISATGLTTNNIASNAAIANGQLANSATTLGTTTMTLGGTVSSVVGLNSISANTIIGTLSGTANSATNLAGGTLGALPYQSATGITNLLSAGTDGQVLTMSSGVPAWLTNSSVGGINSIGAISGTSNVNGATISGSTQLILTPADANFGGIVTTATQTFAGAKTFTNTTTFNKDVLVNGLTVGSGNFSDNSNIALGSMALSLNTSGTGNVAIGQQALTKLTTTNNNTAVGKYASYYSVGTNNTSVGYQALYGVSGSTTGSANVAIGVTAMQYATTAANNVSIGGGALANNSNGHNNVVLGYATGQLYGTSTGVNLTKVDQSVLIGAFARAGASSSTNEVVIGYNVIGKGTNTVTIGTASNTANYFTGDINLTGNVSGGTWSGTTISVAKGGTGLTSPGAAGNVLTSDGTNWISSAAASGVNTLTYNTVTSTSYTNGGNISGTTLYLGDANASSPGLVSTKAQTFAGLKTFSPSITGTYNSSGMIVAGTIFTPSLTSYNNNDILTGLDINPTFTNNNSYVGNYGLRVQGVGIGTGGGNHASNTVVGLYALKSNLSTSYNNSAFGSFALNSNTAGGGNTALGTGALKNGSYISYNTAVGYNALYLADGTTGSHSVGNTAVGYNSQAPSTGSTTGVHNTSLGYSSLGKISSGSYNVALGSGAISNITSASNNVAIGFDAGAYRISPATDNVTGTNGIFIGYKAQPSANALTDEIVIGASTVGNGSNTVTIGNNSNTKNYLRGDLILGGTGNITSGIWSATAISVTKGGTGLTTVGTNGQVLSSDGTNMVWANAGSSGVPYTGATGAVNLGAYDLKVNTLTVGLGAGTNKITNTALGVNSLFFNTTGQNNTAVGYQTLLNGTTAGNNTAIGVQVLYNNSGVGNTGVGTSVMAGVAAQNTGSYNTVVGSDASVANTSGANNVVMGSSALYNNTTGSKNITLGYNAGYYYGSGNTNNLTAVNNSVLIGYDVRPNANSETNQIVIAGYNGSAGTIGLGSNSTSIGNSATTKSKIFGALTIAETTPSESTSISTGSLVVPGGVGISGDVNIGGNINAGTWSATTISVSKGGTGLTSPGAAGNVLTSDGTNWISAAGGSGVNTLTYTTSSSYTTGGTISGTSLTLAAADATNPGLVSVGVQTIGGAKTFSNTATFNSDISIAGNITSGVWSGTAISIAKGGTGLTSSGNNGNILTSDGTNWVSSALSTTYTSTASINGGTFSGTTLTLTAADATKPGLLTGSAQIIGGAKTFSSTVTATGALASGTIFLPTLVAAANNDVLTGIDINPNFSNGSFTGVANYGLRVQGIGIGVGGGDAINNVTNTAVGNSALLKNTTTGIWNTGVGYKALSNNLSGSGNTAFGYQSLYNNNSVTYTTALGYNTGNPVSSSYVLTKGIYLGANALPKASSSTTNEIVIGSDLYGNGSNTTTIGNTSTQQSQIYGALTVVPNAAAASTNGISSTIAAQNATTATYGGGNLNLTAGNAGTTGQGGNIVLTPGTSSYAPNTGKVIVSSDMTVNGITAGRGNGNSANNTIFGNAAFGSNTSGTNNVAFGTTSLYANTTGNQNTAIGSFALSSLSGTYHNNTAIGANAIQNMMVGGDNVALGNNAAGVAADGTSLVTSSSQSVFIGSNSKPGTTSSTNEIVIGYNAKGQGDNTTTIGNSSTTQTYLPSGLTMGNSLGSLDATLTLNPNSTSAQGGAEGGQLNFKKSVSTSTYDWFIDQYADANGARLRFLPGRTNPESYGMAISENGYVGMGSIPTSSYRLNVSGTVGATGYVTTSDRRLKTNVISLSSAMKTLNLLIPVSYDKKVSISDSLYEKHEFGFIAQEVQKVLPQLVTEGKDKDHLLSMDYISIIPLLTKAMQEQDAIIKDAQKENKQLKEQLSQQQKRLDAIELALKKLNLISK